MHGGKRANSGGKRAGAGRKKGAATKRTREIADQEAASGELMPLNVMLDVMRRHYADGNYDKAAAIACDAAPYVHSRLSAVTHKGDKDEPIQVVETLVIVDGDSTEAAPAAPGTSGLPSQ